MGKYIFNITEIQRRGFEPLRIEFYGGDITEEYSDIMLVSSFTSDYYPFEGTIFKKIQDKFDVSFTDKLPDGTYKILEGLYDFNTKETEAFKRLWVLEIGKSKKEGYSQDRLFKAFRLLENVINKLEYLGIETISIPLLGTGKQGISYIESATALMSVIKKWSLESSKLKTVKIFAFDLAAAATLNQAIDAFFGIEQEAINDFSKKLLRALKDELNIKCKTFDESLVDYLDELFNLLDSPSPSVKSIALSGRILAERCSELLINIFNPEIDTDRLILKDRISKIELKINKEKPWILSYFRLLQASGNYEAHNKQLLNLIDAAAIIIATLRISEYTNEKIISYRNCT